VDALERRIQVQVREAFRKREEAGSRYAIARRNVSKARRTVELVNERYGQGRTILIDLLQAERALVETRREALASALSLQVNEAALDFATGRLARGDVQ
jgi:outer membrane protein TolC